MLAYVAISGSGFISVPRCSEGLKEFRQGEWIGSTDNHDPHLSNDVYTRGVDVVEIGQIKVFVQKFGLKQGFLADTNQ